jgi:hypothetical protein
VQRSASLVAGLDLVVWRGKSRDPTQRDEREEGGESLVLSDVIEQIVLSL